MPEPVQAAPIRILSEEVANQIAAGEVVERPASVLKELLENSLDAGAGRISVEAEGGGRRLIRVVDDGAGMPPDDALLALERHATSKLASAEDLLAVATMGFRGEALPSIAAVSRFLLRTRAAGHETGCEIQVAGGSVRKVDETGCPQGTVIEVRDLFFNTPARRKFLKSQTTENAHLAQAVIRLALARPEVAFRFSSGGRMLYDLPPAGDLAARAAALLGREAAEQMTAVDVRIGPLHLRGLAGLPSLSRAGYEQVYTFVNRRFVRDKVLLHAIGQAYAGLMPQGRRPVLILDLELDPALVDVNVHPAKTEVRFRTQQEVHDALAQGLRSGLAGARPQAAPRATTTPQPPPPPAPRPGPPVSTWPAGPRTAPLGAPGASGVRQPASQLPRPAPQPGPRMATSVAPPAKPLFGPAGELQVIGQLHGLYVLCASPSGLVIMDQHAAHERLTYNQLKRALTQGGVPKQGLLNPVTLELSPTESLWAEKQAPAWQALGLVLEPFGGNTWAVSAVPPILAGRDPRPLVHDLLSALEKAGASPEAPEFMDQALKTMACHRSVRAGQRLSPEEAEDLVARAAGLDPPVTCPHGRPVFLSISRRELARFFKRGSEPETLA